MANIKEVFPEETRCSAHATRLNGSAVAKMLKPNSNPHSRPIGKRTRLSKRMGISTTEPNKNRIETERIGGMCATTTRIAPHVLPHIRLRIRKP